MTKELGTIVVKKEIEGANVGWTTTVAAELKSKLNIDIEEEFCKFLRIELNKAQNLNPDIKQINIVVVGDE